MKKTAPFTVCVVCFLGLLALLCVAGPEQDTSPQLRFAQGQAARSSAAPFFPVSVWYGGGRSRAPILEPVTADSRRAWSEDLRKIKSLGFNTVRTWIEWSAAEPRLGEYHFEPLELMLSLAEELDLKVMVQVYSLKRFRSWLEKKYGTLHELNRAWYRRFEQWSEPTPPRFGTILSYSDYMDWRVFITEKLAEDLRLRHQAVKQIDPHHITSSHAAVPSVFTSLAAGDGTPDDWLMSQAVDFYGTSFYPKHSFPAGHWSLARRALAMDFTRAANGEKASLSASFRVVSECAAWWWANPSRPRRSRFTPGVWCRAARGPSTTTLSIR